MCIMGVISRPVACTCIYSGDSNNGKDAIENESFIYVCNTSEKQATSNNIVVVPY